AVAFLGWAALTVVAFVKLPRGYPLGWRFVLHDALPWMLALTCLAGWIGLWRPVVSRGALELLAAIGLAAATGCAVRFPESVPALQIGFAVVGVLTLTASAALYRAALPPLAHVAVLAVGAMVGLSISEALRAPDPSTRPSGTAFDLPDRAPQDRLSVASDGVRVFHGPGWSVEVNPFFMIESRSPDRGWTALAPPTTPHRTVWTRYGAEIEGSTQRSWWRSDDGRGVIAWTDASLDAAFVIDAPVFVHLATWASIRIAAADAFLRFSPCGETAVEVRPSDYPEGRPVRFAYFSAGDRLVVAEATTGEKGPFHTLCEGPLRRGDPLFLSAPHARGEATIALLDFAGQASVEPSPTAGWGVPQNAIQLMREGNSESGAIIILISLAATGVGRGWDTVGLAAGTYVNRIRVDAESE
ncbi:MAG: hypothetical protein AAGF12_31070, partial [Myxococcota bacterium]